VGSKVWNYKSLKLEMWSGGNDGLNEAFLQAHEGRLSLYYHIDSLFTSLLLLWDLAVHAPGLWPLPALQQ